jgi:hypothetical protein
MTVTIDGDVAWHRCTPDRAGPIPGRTPGGT